MSNERKNKTDVTQLSKYRESLNQIEEWTGLSCSEIIFDSNKHSWSMNTSIFDDKIIGKKQLLFFIEEENGEQFGYYLNTEVFNVYLTPFHNPIETDLQSFEFNVFSNGRLEKPMKYEVINEKQGGYYLFAKSYDILIQLGDIVIFKQNRKERSFYIQYPEYFDYHNIDFAFTDRKSTSVNDAIPCIPKRILVIQMI